MKKLLLLLVGASAALTAYAQLPRWVIRPCFDTIYVKVDNRLLQCEVGGEKSLWTMGGEQLYTTDKTILPYKDEVAMVVADGGATITGFVDLAGRFTALPNLQVAYDNPYFENGLLICATQEGFDYYKMDATKATFPKVVRSYPFHGGYAPYFTYEQPEKRKDPHYGFFRADGSQQNYWVQDGDDTKALEQKNLTFLSGISTTGKAVAVIKDKLYWYDVATEVFEPMTWRSDDSEKQQQLKLTKDYDLYFCNLPTDRNITFEATYGKKHVARLVFDPELRPVMVAFEDQDITFKTTSPSPATYASRLEPFGPAGNCGLTMDSQRVLPQQFEQTGLMYDNKAMVKLNGKWGIVEILPNLAFTLRINKGEDIAFRHQKFETQLRLDLPVEISAKETKLDISEQTGCVMDKTSREDKDTESGNFVTYSCTLNIPPTLPDTITTIVYEPFHVSTDGISLFDVPITVRAWHLKYYNVDPIDSETTISDGIASFTININAQRMAGESDYPFEVRIEADSISVEYEKISETRYKCTVSNLQEGNNNLNIIVTEKGCPSSVFPFELFYTKPVPKKKTKEEIIIRKKSAAPRLEV